VTNDPVRQWVLTTPFAVRHLLALRPDALTAAGRIFVEEIARWQKQKATARGTPGSETGSVTFVQRFDSTLGNFVHFQLVALDGVFTRKDGTEARLPRGPCALARRHRRCRRTRREAHDAVAAAEEARRLASASSWLDRGGDPGSRLSAARGALRAGQGRLTAKRRADRPAMAGESERGAGCRPQRRAGPTTACAPARLSAGS
jgi:hypothetical protein